MQAMDKPPPVGAHHRLLSCITSGSERSSGAVVLEEDALCLSELVHDFLEGRSSGNDLDDSERVDSASECDDLTEGESTALSWRVRNNVDPYRKQLLLHVSEAVEMFSFLTRDVAVFRRNVVAFLRENGHNATICNTKWDGSDRIMAGNHEFIDVAREGSSTWQTRYFVEVDFPSQFDISRPTRKYNEMLSSLPGIFVGRTRELKRTVRVVCDVAKQCFECTGLTVPPWRKNRFMKNKWFAPYRRITNPVQGIPVPAAGETIHAADCRFVGFYDVVSEARPVGVSVRTR